MDFEELDLDARRETVNSRQRFEAWREAYARARDFRGSMTWSSTKGREYLLRSSYDRQGRRRQVSLGPRTADTEAIKASFETGRTKATSRLDSLRETMIRQAAINRALGLGRLPVVGSRVLRTLENAGVLGSGIRVLGTNALYAYEAAAGVRIGGEFLETGDVDLLLDARSRLAFYVTEPVEGLSLLKLLQRADESFERSKQTFRAANRQGYLVDLIKPLRNPPWRENMALPSEDPADLIAVEIEGLVWHESAPAFEAIVIDARGEPLRLVTSDPRVFAAHKLWLSNRADRDPIKRRRDRAQAKAVAALVATYMINLPYVSDELRMLPRSVFRAAEPLFIAGKTESGFDL